jgi:nucleoid-associated protein YgaU
VDQHNSSVAELTGWNAKLTSERTALQAQLAQAKQAADQGATTAATVTQLTAANAKLEEQAKDLTAKLTAAQARLADSDKAVEQHSVSVAELTETNDRLTAEKVTLKKQLEDLTTIVPGLRADSDRLAQSEQARLSAEQRAAGLATVTNQLSGVQRDNASLRSDNARLNETMQSLDRDRTSRIAQLQTENAAISARLRQAQGTLDQITNAARIINGGAYTPSPNYSSTPARPTAPSPVSVAPPVPEVRTHVVQEGDSLTRISVRYYGTATRWQEIYDANREVLKGENALRPGQRLRIP